MKPVKTLRKEARTHWNDSHKLLSTLHVLSSRSGSEVVDLRQELISRLFELVEPSFPFPSHNCPTTDGSIAPNEWPDMGLLRVLDYRVGRKKGVPFAKRKQLLHRAYEWDAEEHLPTNEAVAWGDPETRSRMQKIVQSIAGFKDMAERREESDMGIAIHQWERDLEYLRQEFSAEYPDLSWPNLD